MALPEKFSSSKHAITTLIKSYNKEVKEYFKDLSPNELDPDITVPRQSLYIACLIRPNESLILCVVKMLTFYIILRRAQDLQTPVYGIPLPDLQSSRKFKPQITLKFREDLADVDDDYDPVWGEISFRLMNEESTTITKTELTNLANKIKLEFASGNGYVWRKGKKMYSYTDKAKGYQFQILAREESDASSLIDKILDIQSHTPDWSKFKTNATGKSTTDELEAYPYTPGSQIILGETEKLPRRRPNVNVRFSHAECSLWGKGKAFILYDASGTYLNTFVE
jgi:hypothetical protein